MTHPLTVPSVSIAPRWSLQLAKELALVAVTILVLVVLVYPTAWVFVASFRNPEQDGDGRLWYGLLDKRGSDYRLGFPMCKETRSIAEAVGAAFVPDPKVPTCDFRDRASLETGLKRVAAEGAIEFARLVPAKRNGEGD